MWGSVCEVFAPSAEKEEIKPLIDNSDLEMDCLGCNLSKDKRCSDCCRNWDSE